MRAFCLAAALSAAAVTDPIVESLSNAGLFGHARYTDGSNLDVIPALCVAAALALIVLVRWLRLCDAGLPSVSLAAALPKIFPLQLGMLFAMESLEQIAVSGHFLGGTIWLGGPVMFSIAAHALGCCAMAWLLSRALRWSAGAIARIMQTVLTFLRAHVPNAIRHHAHRNALVPNFIEPFIRALAGRAPPVLLPVPTH